MTGREATDADPLSMAYSIADQSFARTKSLGILNLSLQLAAALALRGDIPRFEVFSNSSLREWHGRFARRPVRCFDGASATRLGRILWDQQRVYSEARKSGVQWLLLPKGFASFCRTPPVRIAAYVHDVMEDWYRDRYTRAVSRFEAWYFRQSLLATLRHAAVVFTNSDFTRRELLAFSGRHGLRPPAIVVAGIGFSLVERPGVPSWPEPETASSDRGGIVVLASPLPHKRTDLAMTYVSEWQRRTRYDGPVHWVGQFPAGVHRASYPRWVYHERMAEHGYRALLDHSAALVYFSEYEGFGMPPIEAVLHGACPVYSDLPSTREVMEGAGAPFENASFESFVAAMDKALRTYPAQLASAAKVLRARHSWPDVADRIIGALSRHAPDAPDP